MTSHPPPTQTVEEARSWLVLLLSGVRHTEADTASSLADFEAAIRREERERIPEKTWCAYCSAEFSTDIDLALIEAHIYECPKHPLATVTAERDRLFHALKAVHALQDTPAAADVANRAVNIATVALRGEFDD